jgi:hypothetical protein
MKSFEIRKCANGWILIVLDQAYDHGRDGLVKLENHFVFSEFKQLSKFLESKEKEFWK